MLEHADADANEENEVEDAPINNKLASKESRVSQIYRNLVYYPFIHVIHINYYQMDESKGAEVLENLMAVSWMDGCFGQLKLTTREDVLDKEHTLKIICNKHSAAHTAVEQDANVGLLFKVMEKLLRYMQNLKSCQ